MDKHDRQRELGAMNAFDRARAKHENKTKPKVSPVVAEAPAPAPVEAVPVVSEAKPRKEAIFDVRVRLPDGEIAFTITKQGIYENVPRSKVTQHELRKAVANGLEALMGRVQ